VWEFLLKDGIEAAKAVMALDKLDAAQRGQTAELLLDIGFHCVMDSDRRLAKRNQKKPEGLKNGEDKNYIWAETYTPMSMFPRLVPDEWKKGDHPDAKKLAPVGSITVTDPSKTYLKEPATLKPGRPVRIANVLSTRGKDNPLKNCPSFIASEKKVIRFESVVDYKVGDIRVKYTRPVEIDPWTRHRRFHNVRKVWIGGRLARDYYEWSFQVLLPSGSTLNFTDQSERGVGWTVIPAGTPGRFLVSSGDQWEGLVHEIDIADPWYGVVKPARVSCEGKFEGKAESLTDRDPKTVVTVARDGPLVITYEFDKPTELTAFIGNARLTMRVDAWLGEKWQPFGAPFRTFMYRIPTTTAKRFRVEIAPRSKIGELHPLRSPEHGQVARETGQP
jgi:hypothetical protein